MVSKFCEMSLAVLSHVLEEKKSKHVNCSTVLLLTKGFFMWNYCEYHNKKLFLALSSQPGSKLEDLVFFATIFLWTVHEKLQNLENLPLPVQQISQ